MMNLETQEVKQYIAANIHSLQQARLDTLKNATLEDLFRGRNPYYLRAQGQAAHQLMRGSLDHYLESTDETHFANFSRDLAQFSSRENQHPMEPSDIIEHFAHGRLPMRIELLEAYDRSLHRLLRLFYLQFCDDDANVHWECLTRFISENDAQNNLRDFVGNVE